MLLIEDWNVMVLHSSVAGYHSRYSGFVAAANRSINAGIAIVREMVQELRHRIDPFPARGASRHDNTFSALRNGRRLIHEMAEVVAAYFGLERVK